MSAFVVENARVLTLAGPAEEDRGPRRGRAMGELRSLDPGAVLVAEGRIRAVGTAVDAPPDAPRLNARGRVLMPAFVDAHTHACFAGSRLDEWEAKLAGASYLELLKAGGGILATVRATRAASVDELADGLTARLQRFERHGTGAVEVKSGYGLTTADELKMLLAIEAASSRVGSEVVATACIGHAIDPDEPRFVERTIEETLPAVHEAYPGVAVDAYCEEGAWSREDTGRLLRRAADLGHPLRLHVDQFHALGMLEDAIALGCRSVDHLEATGPDGLRRLAASDTVGVLLPASGFHTDGRYADGRTLIDAGGAVVVASNFNPGSSPVLSLPFVVALAVRRNGLTPAEAIVACTRNGAALLGLEDRGRVAAGARADLLLLDITDERELAHEAGSHLIAHMWLGGEPVPPTPPQPPGQPRTRRSSP